MHRTTEERLPGQAKRNEQRCPNLCQFGLTVVTADPSLLFDAV